ncbi:hypothetical protein DI392_06100 [Vibrio albus]|uniref:Uncharacterized protein n=1 Tax=Vibrio albus TaxID=2200953 RepID=A0A2U3BCY8_9VIBR|nr:helix-turn-helix domain-containing protein [Vibrio albus]PWI34668.1 hypothetical protein DI392_06100 [Vibrio albus]
MHEAVSQDGALKANHVLLLTTILSKTNKDLEAVASYEQLAKWTMIGERTLKSLVKGLVDEGWLTYQKGNTGYANVYQIALAKLRPHAKYYLPEAQSKVCKYKFGKRELKALSLEFNTKNRPRFLREDEDISILEAGTYFVKPNDSKVYLVRDDEKRRYAVSMDELSDFERAYASRIDNDFEMPVVLTDVELKALDEANNMRKPFRQWEDFSDEERDAWMSSPYRNIKRKIARQSHCHYVYINYRISRITNIYRITPMPT